MKLCKDCKKLIDSSICGDEKAFVDIDLVTGNRKYIWARSCRSYDDYCGEEAAWFESKEPMQESVIQPLANKRKSWREYWLGNTLSRGPG